MERRLWLGLFGALLACACGPSSSTGNGDGGGNPGQIDSGFGPPGCQGAGCYNYCPTGSQTTISGRVTAPNGIDPVPGAVVYVPSSLNEFPQEVACEVCNQITDAALVSTKTETDGTFTLGPIPTSEADVVTGGPFTVGVVTQKGRFRRLSDVVVDVACSTNTPDPANFRLPSRNEPGTYNNIPKIAVATGDYDIMECVLLKLGIEQGQFDLYEGAAFATGGGSSGGFDGLLANLDRLLDYNIIFINCTGDTWENLLTDPTIRGNVEQYVASGGRLYVTDWSYDYVEQVWSDQIDFGPGSSAPAPAEPMNEAAIGDDGITTEAQVLDQGMGEWLNAVEQVTGEEIISADNRVHIEHFLSGWVMQFMVPPNSATNTTVWLEGNVTGAGLSGNLPLTTTFDYNSCGRVLYSSYHTRGRDGFGGLGGPFPGYCPTGEGLSPQERVLEYLILHIADCLIVE